MQVDWVDNIISPDQVMKLSTQAYSNRVNIQHKPT